MAVKSYQAQGEGEISLSKGEKIKGKGAGGRAGELIIQGGTVRTNRMSYVLWRPQRALRCPLLPAWRSISVTAMMPSGGSGTLKPRPSLERFRARGLTPLTARRRVSVSQSHS